MSNYQSTMSNESGKSSPDLNPGNNTPLTYADELLRDRRNGNRPTSRNNSSINVIELGQDSQQENQHHQHKPELHVWDLGSLYLENKGAVARDHLASERTFLAWLRTSLAFATIGVGVTQLFKLSSKSSSEKNPSEVARFAKPLGLLFVATSILTLLFGVSRYFLIQRLLIEGIFPASRLFIGIILVIVFILIILTMVIVLISSSL